MLRLADRAGVDVGEVYRVDASRRTTGANAYVNGLGHTKRVVLYDNLIEDFPDDQVRSVVAHELGHVQAPRRAAAASLWLALVAPAGMFLVQRAHRADRALGEGSRRAAARRCCRRWRCRSRSSASAWDRRAQRALAQGRGAAPTRFALQLTRDPAALHRAGAAPRDQQHRATPTRRALLQLLFGTHPTTLERIGIGEACARENR